MGSYQSPVQQFENMQADEKSEGVDFEAKSSTQANCQQASKSMWTFSSMYNFLYGLMCYGKDVLLNLLGYGYRPLAQEENNGNDESLKSGNTQEKGHDHECDNALPAHSDLTSLVTDTARTVNVGKVEGTGNILVQGGDSSNLTVTTNSTGELEQALERIESKVERIESKVDDFKAEQDGSASCQCRGACNCKAHHSHEVHPAVVPYSGRSHSKPATLYKVFDHLFKLRHSGQFEDLRCVTDILQGMPGFGPNIEALISLSRMYSAWVEGASSNNLTKISTITDALIRLTDTPVEFDAHRLNATVLMNVDKGELTLGLSNSESAIQVVCNIRPGIPTGFVLSGRAYVLSSLVANEECPEVRRQRAEEGIKCCTQAIENFDEEENKQHLPVTCTNMTGQNFLYIAMLYLQCSFPAGTTERERKIPPENLEGARKALEEANRLDCAPFIKTRYYLAKSDFSFREGQMKDCQHYYKEALNTATKAKCLARDYGFRSELQQAEDRIAFLKRKLVSKQIFWWG